jgi:SAM-dependent methyltransferase
MKDFFDVLNLSTKRFISQDHYWQFEKRQGELLAQYLLTHGVNIENRLLIDLGCGLGGYSYVLANAGARVIGLDLDIKPLQGGLDRITGDATRIPLEHECVDIVLCSSLIEHVANPKILLDEICRIVKKSGWVYISFPPFYSPVGGHQFAPFHLLGERVALAVFLQQNRFKGNEWVEERINMNPQSYLQAFGGWGLYRFTIRKMRQILKDFPLELTHQSTRYLPFDLSKIPFLGEILTWHVQFLCKKI